MTMHEMVNFVVSTYSVSSFPHRQYCCTFCTLEVYTHMKLAFEMHETAMRNITQQCLCAYCISHRIQALYQAIDGEGVSETKGMVGRVVTAATQQKGL